MYLIVFEPPTFVIDEFKNSQQMLSQKFVSHKSSNFTSDNEIRMPPTLPINHYFGPKEPANSSSRG